MKWKTDSFYAFKDNFVETTTVRKGEESGGQVPLFSSATSESRKSVLSKYQTWIAAAVGPKLNGGHDGPVAACL